MRKLLIYLIALAPPLACASAASAAPEECGVTDGRRAEAALLNRRVDTNGIVQYGATGWQKLKLPAAPVILLNLWSRTCKPCLEELPELGHLMQEYPRVPFVFIADPPAETSREEVAQFWAQPVVELPAGRCKSSTGVVPPRGSENSCRLTLPDTPPVRSEDARLAASLQATAARPITLLLDRSGVVRQAFVGSLLARTDELRGAIDRLRSLQAEAGAAPRLHR